MDVPSERPRPIRALRRRLFRQPPVAAAVSSGDQILYRVGAISILAVGLLYFAGAAMSVALGPVPSGSEEYLKALAGHATLARVNFAAFSAVDVLLIPFAIALYRLLGASPRRLLLLAGACFAVNLVIDLGVTELHSFALTGYAEQYVAAAGGSQRAEILASASASRAILPVATLLSFVVSSVGYLAAAIATFRAVFRQAIGVVGVIGSAEGVLAGFYVPFPPLAALILPCLVTVGLWAVFVGIRMWRVAALGQRPQRTSRRVEPIFR